MTKPSKDDLILTFNEMAERLKISDKTLIKYLIHAPAKDRIPAFKVGKEWRFNLSKVMEFFEKRHD